MARESIREGGHGRDYRRLAEGRDGHENYLSERELKERELVTKLTRFGVLKTEPTLDHVLDLTLEDVLEVLDKEKPKGVIVQYGGQTPLKLARDLEAAGVPVIGTTPDCIDLAEDRERFQQVINELGLKQPPNRLARSTEEAVKGAE